MLALTVSDTLALTDVPAPIPEPDEAVVEVHRAGICGTDLALAQGYADFQGVLGHEFVGEVIESEAAPQWVGRRVVGEINVACGRCDRCRRGTPNHCSRREVLGVRGRSGALAAEIVLPVGNLHEVPEAIDDDAAALVEPLAAAFRILEQIEITASTNVAVWGDGRLGLLTAMVLATTGCRLTVVGRHPHKLAIASDLGATTRASDAVMRPDFDVVVDATGSPTGFASALRHVRPRGTLVLKSTLIEAPRMDASRLVVDEITVLGSRCGPFEPALAALAAGDIDPSPLIEAIYPLSRGLDAFAHAARRGALKVLVDPRRT